MAACNCLGRDASQPHASLPDTHLRPQPHCERARALYGIKPDRQAGGLTAAGRRRDRMRRGSPIRALKTEDVPPTGTVSASPTRDARRPCSGSARGFCRPSSWGSRMSVEPTSQHLPAARQPCLWQDHQKTNHLVLKFTWSSSPASPHYNRLSVTRVGHARVPDAPGDGVPGDQNFRFSYAREHGPAPKPNLGALQRHIPPRLNSIDTCISTNDDVARSGVTASAAAAGGRDDMRRCAVLLLFSAAVPQLRHQRQRTQFNDKRGNHGMVAPGWHPLRPVP